MATAGATGPTVGVFTTDRELVIRSWDAWLASATGITEEAAVGQPLGTLFPDLEQRGMLARLHRVANGAGVEVLAPALHRYFLDCAPTDPASAFDRMRQHATLAPLRNGEDVIGAVVTIQDVTARLEKERELVRQLRSHDEAIRVRAAQALAERDAPVPLLADAMGDASWRVRRAAAAGMARDTKGEAVATLTEAMRERHEDPALLSAVLQAITTSEDDRVIESVCALLDSDDPDVRIYAALALGLLGTPRAVPALAERLGDADMNVRFHVIEALGRIGDPAVAEALVKIAESREFFLAFAALDALARIADPRVAPRVLPLLGDPMLLPAAAACLGAMGSEQAVIPLTRALASTHAPAGGVAAALVKLHDRAEAEVGEGAVIADMVCHAATPETIEALARALGQATDEDLRPLVRVLGWLPHEGIDETLAPLLTHEGVRETVAHVLAGRGTRATSALLEVATRGDVPVRMTAAVALGRIGDRAAVPALIAMLDGPPDVIVAAAGALGAIGDGRGFQPLLKMMDHPDAAVRQAVVSALNSLGHADMPAAVLARLDNPSPRTRESAIRIAGYFGYAECLDGIIARCQDDDESVRRAAVEHLASYEEERAWTAILAALTGDASPAVRSGAARALGLSQDARSRDALFAASREEAPWVRYYALRSLVQRDADARVVERLLSAATGDAAVPVRIAAIEGLGQARAVAALPALEVMVEEPEGDVAVAAIGALGRFEPAVTAATLMRALERDDARVRVAAIDALGRQGATVAVPALATQAARAVEDEVRVAAARALALIESPDATAALETLSSSRRSRPAVVAARSGVRGPARAVLARALGAT